MTSVWVMLIITIIMLILYVWEPISLTMTSLIVVLAMIFTGILSPSDAFSGFGNTSTIMVAGMLLLGKAVLHTGLSAKFAELLEQSSGLPEKWFNVIVYLIGGITTVFFTGIGIMAALIPVIDSIEASGKSSINRKGAYMPLAVSTVIGATISVVGSTSGLNGFTILTESEYAKEMGVAVSFFRPAILGIPLTLAGLVFYMTVGTRLQRRFFNFEETSVEADTIAHIEKANYNRKKFHITGAVMLGCLVLWMSGKLNIAAVTLLGVVILMITGCLEEKKAYKSLEWSTIILVGASISIGKGIQASGLAQMIAQGIVDHSGFFGETPWRMCMIIMLIGILLSNFMSNNSAVTIIVPISIMIAETFHADPFPFAMSAITGCNMALSTPICTANHTMVLGVGYRFKDYLRVGSLITLMGIVACGAVLKFVYFM